MALRPALTISTACPPVRAPSALTYSSACSRDQSRSAPWRARLYSIATEPRRRTTSAAEYGRVTPFQRDSVAHWRSRSATAVSNEVVIGRLVLCEGGWSRADVNGIRDASSQRNAELSNE